jgi:hypothetical protein
VPDSSTRQKPDDRLKLADLPPDKLAAFVARLEEEQAARTTAKVEAGEAVRIQVLQINREDIGAARQRALMQHGPLEGKVPVFDVVGLITGVDRDPGGIKAQGSYDFSTSPSYEASAEQAHPGSRPIAGKNAAGPPPQRVLIDHDGGIVEGWFTLSADNVVQLCNMFGSPEPGEDRVTGFRHQTTTQTALPRYCCGGRLWGAMMGSAARCITPGRPHHERRTQATCARAACWKTRPSHREARWRVILACRVSRTARR